MPYDVVAYEADDLAMQLSEAEEGLFHRMLRRSWMNESIPSDLKELRHICRTSLNRLKKAWVKIEPLWKPHPSRPGRLINLKQESERDYRVTIRKQNQLAGIESAKSRKLKTITSTSVGVPLNTRSTSLPFPSLPLLKESSSTQHSANSVYTDEFEKFWKIYPRKKGKGKAFEQWQKNGHPGVDRIITVLELAKQHPDWLRDGGQFIPHPATWLSQKRWDDDYGQPQPIERKAVY